MRLLFSTTTLLCLLFVVFCVPQKTTFYQLAHAQTIPPPTPPWFIEPGKMNIAVLMVDYKDSELQQAYFMQEEPCQQPLSAQTIITNARRALSNTITGNLIDTTLQTNGLLAESLDWESAFMAWQVHLGDFTANALLHPCTGNVIFAGESIWAGYGERPYPHNPLPAQALLHLSEVITPPLGLATIEPSTFITKTAVDAWAEIANLNLVHDLARQPFQTVAFLYRPATGYVDPAEELAEAQWIFILYSEPATLGQTNFAHYLPLIRQ